MSLFLRIRRSGFGQWLIGVSRKPLLGPPVRAVARLAKSSEQRVVRMTPAHRAHDDKQKATLAAFSSRHGGGK